MLGSERKDAVLKLACELIRRKSYSGEEKEIAEYIADYCRELKFDEVFIDDYGNVICGLFGSRPGKTLLFDGHIDTVPVEDASKWSSDPFEPVVRDGKLYGRGASDMKCADAGFIAAAAFFAEDFGRDFAGKIYIAGCVHEECFEGLAARSIAEHVKPDIVVIGEASELNVKISQRGRAEVLVETFGVPAHSSNPDRGVNSVYSMMKLIDRIRQLEPPVHPFMGKGILELTDIISRPYPGKSVLPEYTRATFDRRLLAGETKEKVLAPIQKIIDELSAEDKSFKAKVSITSGREECYTGRIIEGERFFPGWMLEDETLPRELIERLKAKGYNPELKGYNFCTNGSHYAGEAGITCIGMGPSLEELAHVIDEYCELDELMGVTECYYTIMEMVAR